MNEKASVRHFAVCEMRPVTRLLCIVLFSSILLIIATIVVRCDRRPLYWNSPRFLEIEQEWKSQYGDGPGDKDHYEKWAIALDRVLAKRISYSDVLCLALSCGTIGATEAKRSDFDNEVLTYMVRVLVAAGDRVNLVKLLASRCPCYVYPYVPIEQHTALRGTKMSDPLLILGDAYLRCQDARVRHVIAMVLRRGFTDPKIRGANEAEFVTHTMQWYERNKSALVVNDRYGGNSLIFPQDEFELPDDAFDDHHAPFRWQPLFVKRPSEDK
jgi:hypothetical protein